MFRDFVPFLERKGTEKNFIRETSFRSWGLIKSGTRKETVRRFLWLVRWKVDSAYKSIYLRQTVIDELDKLAAKYNTSFNGVVVAMIEQCLEDIRREEEQEK